MSLQGYVRIDNGSGDDYENARTRVVIGKVNLSETIASLAARQYPYGSPLAGGIDFSGGAMITDHYRYVDKDAVLPGQSESHSVTYANGSVFWSMPKEVVKQRLSEYMLYTIEGRESIPNGWGKRLPSFDPVDTPVENLYKYDEGRWGNQVVRFLSFANDEEHELGDTPLPNGRIRVFAAADRVPPVPDPAGHYLTYVGQAPVKYIPVGEEVELELGEARELLVEPTLLSKRTENFEYDRHGNVSGWDDVLGWRIDIRNARRVPATVEITRAFPTAYWSTDMRDHEQTFAKHDATHARFTIDVPPRERRKIHFDLRLHYGTREDDWQEPVSSQDKRNEP